LTGLVATRVTGTTATVQWATSTGIVAQVEYGATPNYGQFTLLQVFGSPTQHMALSGLQPATLYHFRVKGWDASGALGASADATFKTAPAGVATLIGDDTVQLEHVTLSGGNATAYQYVASQSGQASVVRLYVDAGSTAPVVRVALYSDQNGAPGTILSQGSAPGLVPGWVAISLPPVPVVESTPYWIAVLNPLGGASLNLRQALIGGSSVSNVQTTLAAFPQAWNGGPPGAKSPLSAYLQQVPPAITMTAPVDGAILTGQTQVSVVIDDDVPLTRVQFLVDNAPVGQPLVAAPYTTTIDTTGLNATVPHTISVKATDLMGRSSTSSVVTVQVDNGPRISAVSISPGLSATSMGINWTTDVLADGQVEFGMSQAYGSMTPLDGRADWHHSMELTGLTPGTQYHYRVRSRDANGALAVSSDQTFFTAPQ
jgi:hypothetical protein